MIVIAGNATIKPEYIEEGIHKAREMMAATQQEQGCISYRIYSNPTEPTEFFIFEEWENEEALNYHFQTDHLRSFGAFLSQAATAPLNIKRYQISAVSPL